MAMPMTAQRFVVPILILTLATAGTARGQSHPDLAGGWELNAEQSTAPRRSAPRTMDRGPGGGGPMGRRPGTVAIPNEDEFPMPRGDAGIAELLRAKQHLQISAGNDGVTIQDDAGWTRTLVPDGGKRRDEESQGGAAAVETKWKGDKLVTERQLDRGVTIKETFSLDRKANRLVVELELRAERMPRAVQRRRVYDRAPA